LAFLVFTAMSFTFPEGSRAQTPAPGQQPATTPGEQAPAVAAPADPSQSGAPIIKRESKLVLVDAIVTDKKGSYVHDLSQRDFKVYEDNKEQQVSSFSFGADLAGQQANQQKRYLILFFDNSSMARRTRFKRAGRPPNSSPRTRAPTA
jgi:hypothetical protein